MSPFTTKTETFELFITLFETEPSTVLEKAPNPLFPITIKSISCSSANFVICCAGFPLV